MKLIILSAILLFVAKTNYVESSLLASTKQWLGMGNAPEDSINVCDPTALQNTQREAIETLQMAADNFRQLSAAIDQNDVSSFLDIMQDWQQQISKNVPIVEGTINATIHAYKDVSVPGSFKRCTQTVLRQFQNLFKVLTDVQTVTIQAIHDFQKATEDVKFYKMQQTFKELFKEIEQFGRIPKSFKPLQQACDASWKATTVTDIIDNLKIYTKKPQRYEEEQKRDAVEASVGLLAQALNLNAVCNAVAYVDEEVESFKKAVKNDIQLSKDALQQIETIVEQFVGQKGFFRRLFGY